MNHNIKFPVLKVKMITPNDNHTYFKQLPQVESKLHDGSKSGSELTWGIDLEHAIDIVDVSTETIDYINGYTDPTTFVYQIVEQSASNGLPDMVYYQYDHSKSQFIEV